MTKRENIAISSLEGQLKTLNSSKFDSTVWSDETFTILKKIFGADSKDKIKAINHISYMYWGEYNYIKEKKGIEQAQKYLHIYINEIKKWGLDEDTLLVQSNSPQKISFGKIIGFLSLLITSSAFAYNLGQGHGKSNSDKEIYNTYNHNTILKKSNDSLNLIISQKNSIIDSLEKNLKTIILEPDTTNH